MPLNKNNLDDLNYLANLGFEKTKVSESDINDLHSKIKNRVFSYNNGLYFSFVSLITGVFIGVSCFFGINNQPKIVASKTELFLKDTTTKIIPTQKTIVLDTVNVQHENFMYPRKQQLIDTTSIAKISSDSIFSVNIEPITLTTLPLENLSTTKIKYIPNASVMYLHDLKITNYSLLYFKKNEQVLLNNHSGISANYSNASNTREELLFQPNYYLHQAIGEAMISYKKADYNQCINDLNIVSQFNKDDINCKFYFGMCFYNKKNYTLAKNYFEDCISNTNNTFVQESQYYKALCLIELGEISEAKILLKQIIDDAQFYSQKAFNTLSKL